MRSGRTTATVGPEVGDAALTGVTTATTAASHTLLLAGRARIHVARGSSPEGVADYKTVVTRSPQPSSVIEHGGLLEALVRQDAAQAQHSPVRSAATLPCAQEVDPDVELGISEADHGAPAAPVPPDAHNPGSLGGYA